MGMTSSKIARRKRPRNPRAVWIKLGRCLHPASAEANEMLDAANDGAELVGDVGGARRPRQLALYWVLCGILVDHGIFMLKETASDVLKFATKNVDMRIIPDTGEVFYAPRSIAFASMSQAEFSEFFDAAIHVIVGRWLTGVSADELRAEIFQALDGPAAIGAPRVRQSDIGDV